MTHAVRLWFLARSLPRSRLFLAVILYTPILDHAHQAYADWIITPCQQLTTSASMFWPTPVTELLSHEEQ
jgi:hypothetical protein